MAPASKLLKQFGIDPDRDVELTVVPPLSLTTLPSRFAGSLAAMQTSVSSAGRVRSRSSIS